MYRTFFSNEMIRSVAKSLLLLACVIFFSGCDKKAPTEDYKYNAFFVFPDGKKAYVGTVTGLSSCKYVVSDYFAKRRKFVKGQWDYICCWKTDDNECFEQHRYNE
jgi:hypothetical protein